MSFIDALQLAFPIALTALVVIAVVLVAFGLIAEHMDGGWKRDLDEWHGPARQEIEEALATVLSIARNHAEWLEDEIGNNAGAKAIRRHAALLHDWVPSALSRLDSPS